MSKVRVYLKKFVLMRKLNAILNSLFEVKRNFMLHRNGYKALSEIKHLSRKDNFLFWLEFGTLLGFVRDHGFIKHDTDLDLGAWFSGRESIVNSLLSAGFKHKYSLIHSGEVIEDRFSILGVNVDFCYFFLNDDGTFYTKVFTKYGNEPYNKFSVLKYNYSISKKLTNITVRDKSYAVHEDYEEYLAQKYGVNWRTPQKSWSFESTPKFEKLKEYGYISHE